MSAASDTPAWLPEEYDPDAPLHERLPVMAEIEGGIELHVRDERGVVEIVGQPQHFEDPENTASVLKAGSRPDNWRWEIVVPREGSGSEPFLRRVDPNQRFEAYISTRDRWMENIDVRILGVDADRFLDGESDV